MRKPTTSTSDRPSRSTDQAATKSISRRVIEASSWRMAGRVAPRVTPETPLSSTYYDAWDWLNAVPKRVEIRHPIGAVLDRAFTQRCGRVG
jgi:hypothetical protein